MLLQAPANSGFSYRVNKDDHTKRGYSSGYNGGQVDFGHNEKKSGDRTTGSYDVVLPDGRRQIVTYYVDGSSGFVADVRYEPAYKSTYESTYESTTPPSYRRA